MKTPRKRRPKAVPVVAQVRAAFAPGARVAGLGGLLFGGSVPVEAYYLAHLDRIPWFLYPLIVGGLVFSAKTVYLWALAAFQDAWKAAGFVVLQEGVMILAPPSLRWLAYSALGILIIVNAVASAASFASSPGGAK